MTSGDTETVPRPVALVAGASRGAGRAVALELGKAGYRVVVSARSTRFGARTESRRETIEDTAEAISSEGNLADPYVCDHLNARELQNFVRWCVKKYDRIDVLVYSVWGGAEGFDGHTFSDGAPYGARLENRTLTPFVQMMETGPYGLLLTLKAFEPVLRRADNPIAIVLGDDPGDDPHPDVFYDLSKTSVLRLTKTLAPEFAEAGITLCHFSPEALATERAVDAGIVDEETSAARLAGTALLEVLAQAPRGKLSGRSLFMRDYLK